MNDFGYAVRQAARRPGLSLVVAAILAIGIGATTAVYSLFHDVLVRSLPVPQPERLVNLAAPGPRPGSASCDYAGSCDEVFSYPMFRDLEAGQTVFAGLAAHRQFDANFAYEGRTLAGTGLLVSGGYFSTLNLTPALGRLIDARDEPGIDESSVVVLSHAYWREHFGADEGVVGRTLTVNGRPLTIVGVAPEGFAGTTFWSRSQVFVPLTLRWQMEPTAPREAAQDRRNHWLYLFARLRPGVSIEQASAGINALYAGIFDDVEAALQTDIPPEDLERFRQRRITLEPGAHGQSWVREESALALTLLLATTLLVLVIVCVNVANLLLARGVSRTGELAVRASLGASRLRLVRQLLAEAGVLALAGGILGVPIAHATLKAIVAIAPPQAAAESLGLSGEAMLFAAAVTLSTAVLFGLVPALSASRRALGGAIRAYATQSSRPRGLARFGRVLCTVQIALSMVLLVLAGLFVRSLANIARVDLGIDAESLVTFTVSPRLNGYDDARTMALYDAIEEALRARPGVTAASSSSIALLASISQSPGLDVEGFEAGYGVDTSAAINDVGTGFFETLSIPLLAGRDLTAADRLFAPRVAVVNESFVRKFGLGEAALGTMLGFAIPPGQPRDIEIVGIVADAKYSRVKGETPPQLFLPRRQNPFLGTMTFYVRGALEPGALMETVRQAVVQIDPSLPLANLTTMERAIRDNVFLDRIVTSLSASLAALATLLAAMGLNGVLAHNVAQRTRELGLRLALGAEPRRLRRMIMTETLGMAIVGAGIGLPAAAAAGRAAEALLFGVSGRDPAVLIAAGSALAAVVLLAGHWPARRASSVAPMQALRYE